MASQAVEGYLARLRDKPMPKIAPQNPATYGTGPVTREYFAPPPPKPAASSPVQHPSTYQTGPTTHTLAGGSTSPKKKPLEPAPGGTIYSDTPITRATVADEPGMAPLAGGADFSSYLGMFGLPSDVVNEVNAIFQRTPDIGQATQLALAYVRGTQWYTQTYPGIQEAIAKGIVRDERDYRARQNQFSQLFQQYYGRDIQAGEYAGFLNQGVSIETVSAQLKGDAIAGTYGGDYQYALGAFGGGRASSEELTALGRQQAGLDTPLGMRVQRRLQMANERISRVFSGTLASPSLSLDGGRLKASTGDTPDIGR